MTTIPIPAAVPDLPPLPIGALVACALDLLRETGDLPQPRLHQHRRSAGSRPAARPAGRQPQRRRPVGGTVRQPSWSARPWRTNTALGRCAAPTSTTTAWPSRSIRLSGSRSPAVRATSPSTRITRTSPVACTAARPVRPRATALPVTWSASTAARTTAWPRPDTQCRAWGSAILPARPATNPSISLPREHITAKENCHASKRRVHVLGPPDALAPGRRRLAGLSRLLG